MALHAEVLDGAFGPSRMTGRGYYYGTSMDIPLREEARWDELIDWMDAQRLRYVETFRAIEIPSGTGA